MTPHVDVVAFITALLDDCGGSMYFGEAVTQKAHALQCAWLAEQDGASDSLVVAALLHDVGHLLDGSAEHRHEDAGEQWLSHFFGPEVSEPVRLHVDAKRYLCAIDPMYEVSLSDASRESLKLQGGPFQPNELRAFLQLQFAQDAVRLRRWDDCAKTPDLSVPGLTHYAARIEALARRAAVAER